MRQQQGGMHARMSLYVGCMYNPIQRPQRIYNLYVQSNTTAQICQILKIWIIDRLIDNDQQVDQQSLQRVDEQMMNKRPWPKMSRSFGINLLLNILANCPF
jgi:hypothetical protein